MLDGIDTIDWQNLETVYGYDTAALLEDITSPDADTARRAIQLLGDNIVHQDTLFGVAPHVVPFLIKLAENPAIHNRAEIISLLALLGSTACFRIIEYPLHPEMWKDAVNTYSGVEAGFELYRRLMTDADREMRLRLCDLMGSLTTRTTEARIVLYEAFAGETDTQVKLQIIRSLESLAARLAKSSMRLPDEEPTFFIDIIRSTIEADEVKTAALFASTLEWEHPKMFALEAGSLSAMRVDILTAAFLRGSNIYQLLDLFRGKGMLEALIRLLDHPDITVRQAHLIGRELMALTFTRPCTPRHEAEFGQYEMLSHERTSPADRKLALNAVIASDKFWLTPTNLFSFYYNLPDSRESLRRYAANLVQD